MKAYWKYEILNNFRGLQMSVVFLVCPLLNGPGDLPVELVTTVEVQACSPPCDSNHNHISPTGLNLSNPLLFQYFDPRSQISSIHMSLLMTHIEPPGWNHTHHPTKKEQ
jgi:hypothetical protein